MTLSEDSLFGEYDVDISLQDVSYYFVGEECVLEFFVAMNDGEKRNLVLYIFAVNPSSDSFVARFGDF